MADFNFNELADEVRYKLRQLSISRMTISDSDPKHDQYAGAIAFYEVLTQLLDNHPERFDGFNAACFDFRSMVEDWEKAASERG